MRINSTNNNTVARGFSLMEVLVSIGIIAIILAIGIPQFRISRANQELSVSAKELKANLEYMRVLAVKLGDPETGESPPKIQFDNPDDQSTGYRLLGKNSESLRKAQLSGGTYIDAGSVSGEIEFNPNGSADISSSYGTLYVRNPLVSKYFEVRVSKSTGMVKLIEY